MGTIYIDEGSDASASGITFTDFATNVLELLGIIKIGQTQRADQTERVRRAFNRTIEQWNIDRILVYQVVPEVLDFTGGKGTYEIGPGGSEFPNSKRPTRIESARFIYGTLSQPLAVWTQQQYAAILMKSLQSTFPQGVYCDYGNPYSKLYFYPVPVSSAYDFELWTWQQLSRVESGSEANAIYFPEGYELALLYNVTKHAAPNFRVEVSDRILTEARRTKNVIESYNPQVEELVLEGLGESCGGGELDYLTGGF